MRLFRLIGNAVQIAAFLVQSLLYWPGRILGSKPALPLLVVAGALIGGANRQPAWAWVYAGLISWGLFRLIFIIIRHPGRLVLFRGPPKPPPPPPRAKAIEGRGDDPDEALVIGRLDPKLRDLLRQPQQPG